MSERTREGVSNSLVCHHQTEDFRRSVIATRRAQQTEESLGMVSEEDPSISLMSCIIYRMHHPTLGRIRVSVSVKDLCV